MSSAADLDAGLRSQAVLERLVQAEPPYVMARGNISSRSGESTRCLFYRVDDCIDDRIDDRIDGRIDGLNLVPLDEMWVLDSELPEVIARLQDRGPIWQASCDAMYATAAERIWIDQPFTYWEDLKRRIWCEGDTLFFDREHIPIADLVSVEAYLERGWVLRGVRLWMRKDGGTRCLKLAEVEDPISEIDPTYDGINLSFETEWAVSMARALSGALGIPLQKHEDMF